MISSSYTLSRNSKRSILAFLALFAPTLWLVNLFSIWFFQPGHETENVAFVFASFAWFGCFYIASRWEAAIGYALFLFGIMLILNAGVMMVRQQLPPPRPPIMRGSPESVKGHGIPAHFFQSTPRLPAWPLPVLVAIGFLGGVSAIATGWKLLRKGQISDTRALEELEEQYHFLKGFSRRYDQTLASWMEEQEKRRRIIVRQRRLTYLRGASVLVILVAVIAFLPLITFVRVEANAVVIGLAIFFTASLAEAPVNLFKAEIKEKLMPEVCCFLGFAYVPKIGENDVTLYREMTSFVERFHDAGIVPDYDIAYKSDIFSGSHDGIPFRVCRVKLAKAGRGEGIAFMGAMIEMIFPQKFSGCTKVLMDLGKFGNKLTNAAMAQEKRVGLSYSKFENVFETYADSQVEARALLTPDIIENFVRMSQLLSGDAALQAAFKGNSLLISVSCDRPLFDAGDMSVPMTDRKRISRFLEEAALVHNIIDMVGVQKYARAESQREG